MTVFTGSIGTRATFITGSPLQPYLSIGTDVSRYDISGAGRQDQTAPQFGTGFSYKSDRDRLSLDLHGRQIITDSRRLDLSLRYDFNF